MPNLLLSGRSQQLHGPLPLCCCQRFPGPSRNSLLSRRKAAIPSAFFVFDEKKSLWEAAGMTKRGRFPVLHWKKDKREERLLLGFFLPLSLARPALEGKISRAGKDRGRESCIFFSSRELQDRRSIRNGRRLQQKQKRSNPFGASGNKKTNYFDLIHIFFFLNRYS